MIDEKKLIECLKYDMSCFETEGKKISQLYVRVDDMVRMINGQPKIGSWIPCSERLPEEPFGCLVTIIQTNPMTLEDFESILPYHVGYDGQQWNDSDGVQLPFEVVAWIPLPEPYKLQEGEK